MKDKLVTLLCCGLALAGSALLGILFGWLIICLALGVQVFLSF